MDMTTVAAWQSDFTLHVEDKDITETVKRGVVSIRFVDNGAATGEMDSLEATLANETLPLPPKGVVLKLALGFKGMLVNKGTFTVCQVSSGGPPRKLTITATAAPVNHSRHGKDVSASRTRTLENITLADIVKTVATDTVRQKALLRHGEPGACPYLLAYGFILTRTGSWRGTTGT